MGLKKLKLIFGRLFTSWFHYNDSEKVSPEPATETADIYSEANPITSLANKYQDAPIIRTYLTRDEDWVNTEETTNDESIFIGDLGMVDSSDELSESDVKHLEFLKYLVGQGVFNEDTIDHSFASM